MEIKKISSSFSSSAIIGGRPYLSSLIAKGDSVARSPKIVIKQSSTRLADPERFLLDKLKSNKRIIENFKKLEIGWNGYNGEPIPHTLINKILQLLPQLDYQPNIFPTGRGTIQLEYNGYKKSYLEIEVSDEANYYFFIKKGAEQEGAINDNQINDKLNEFFA